MAAEDSARRGLEIAAAAAGLIVLLPLMLGLGVWVMLDSPGPALYRAKRVGKDGVPFNLLKFRTMVTGADKKGPAITAAQDSRVTKTGRFLRRTKLDELPQLLNVLRGEMSFVGPRPEDPRYVAWYTEEQRRILRVRPGITSAASLAYRHEERMLTGEDWETRYRTEVMPAKLAIDLAYESQRSLLSDGKLILRTIKSMLD